MRKITFVIIAIVVSVILINWVLMLNFYPASKRVALFEDTYKEIFKFSIQFVLIVIGGGILVQEYNRSRQRIIDYKDFRKDTYKSLVNAYLKTKNIRWLYRADCRDNTMSFQTYKEGLSKIIDVKTQLEVIIHEIEANEKAFKSIKKQLQLKLENMESFIRDLYKEYYKKAPPFVGTDRIDTSELNNLNDFIRKPASSEESGKEQSHFTLHYRTYFYDCLDLLREDRVHREITDVI